MAHHRWKRAIDRLFAADLSPRAQAGLLAHLRLCPDCSHRYDRHLIIEAAAAGTFPLLAPAARERVARRLGLSAAMPEPALKRWGFWLAVPALGAAAAALLLWFFLASPARILSGAHVALGADQALFPLVTKGAEVSTAAEVGIRAFVVKGARDRVEPAAGLTTDDIITFSYSNVRPAIGYLLLFGLQPDGRVILYHPAYPAERSLPIERGVIDQPLRDGIRLSANHVAGPLRVVGLFSAEPLDVAQTLAEVQRNLGPALFTGAPAPLSGAKALEHSLLLDLAPSGGVTHDVQ